MATIIGLIVAAIVTFWLTRRRYRCRLGAVSLELGMMTVQRDLCRDRLALERAINANIAPGSH